MGMSGGMKIVGTSLVCFVVLGDGPGPGPDLGPSFFGSCTVRDLELLASAFVPLGALMLPVGQCATVIPLLTVALFEFAGLADPPVSGRYEICSHPFVPSTANS